MKFELSETKGFKFFELEIKSKLGTNLTLEDEELYLTYMRPIWVEMKRVERSRRCMVSDGKESSNVARMTAK